MTDTRDALEKFRAKYGGGFLNDDAVDDNDKLLQTLARDVWQAATLAERKRMADSLAAKGFADSCVAIVRGGK